MRPAEDPVIVADYDPRWPAQFSVLRDRIASSIGDLVVRVEHVGSTSVTGLAAKPVIDVDVVVRSSADVSVVVEVLRLLGYAHEGDKGIPGREAFRWPAGERRHHLYLCVDGSRALRDHLLFRDYLRAHPEVAADYGALKRDLAAQHSGNRESYAKAKADFIERITKLASSLDVISQARA